jgi:predicted transcriptional regulator of viral defense system
MKITEQVLELIRQAGILRPRDLDTYGIPRTYLQRLFEKGLVERVGRGLYMLPGADISEHHSLVEACKRVPRGVICLLTALRFHGLGTQNPFEVWIAIGQKSWRPQAGYPPLRILYLSGDVFNTGIEEHKVEGVPVRIYSPAKTVADCFKFRNKIGLDVAVEALKEYRRVYSKDLDNLWRMARVCRVDRIIRPYLEAST